MSDIHIRITGRAGRITLTRPQALNAMTYQMCLAIEAALDAWAADDAVALVVIDAEGDRAFCSGGDIAELYETGMRGDFAYGQKFWADEYRLNHKIFSYPKPFVSFCQGFTMGGGVGLGCHGSLRIVGESSQIAMPECGIGLIPDVGGSLMLAQAPGACGAYLGTTGARMKAADAIYAGFADIYIPELKWPELIHGLETHGDLDAVEAAEETAPAGALKPAQQQINALFGDGADNSLAAVTARLAADPSAFATAALKGLRRSSPLSAACTIDMLHQLRRSELTLRKALEMEYRFTFRAAEHGDFLEGIRAAIIDKDRQPNWQHKDAQVPAEAIAAMLAPLGAHTLTLEDPS